jgi:hypothetical protein
MKRPLFWSVILGVIALPVAACNHKADNTPSNVPATPGIQGTVAGYSIAYASAVYAPVTTMLGNGSTQTFLAVAISNQADFCTQLTNRAAVSGTDVLILTMLKLDATMTSVAPTQGKYQAPADFAVDAGLFAYGNFVHTDNICAQSVNADDPTTFASAGTIDITALTPTAVNGTFDLTFGLGDTTSALKGAFEATACPALGDLVDATDPEDPVVICK